MFHNEAGLHISTDPPTLMTASTFEREQHLGPDIVSFEKLGGEKDFIKAWGNQETCFHSASNSSIARGFFVLS